MISKAGPIGVFDSGYGGLTVLKEIIKELPQHDFIYLGDNARAPYGTRSFETVYEYTLQSVKYLFNHGCELVILACNTASAKALRNIQQNDLPKIDSHKRVLGVIRPTSEIIGNYTQTNEIGVLATSGTVTSESYLIEINKFFPHTKVYQEACPMWVPLIENNEFNTAGGEYFIKKHCDKLLSKSDNIDTVILGCTHYPLLINKIKEYMPSNIKIVSQGEIVAASLKDYLFRHPQMNERCSKQGKVVFHTTDSNKIFDSNANLFFGSEVKSVQVEL